MTMQQKTSPEEVPERPLEALPLHPAPAVRTRRRRLPLLGLILALAAAAAGGWWWYRSAHAAPRARYETQAVRRGDVTSKVTCTGTVDAVTKVEVGSQVSGIISALYVDYNTRVKRGQRLAQIDPTIYQAQLNNARANLDQALAGLNSARSNAGNARANVKAAEAGIASARAHVETARAALANARASLASERANVAKAQATASNSKRNYERYEALLKKDLVATSDRDTQKTQYLVDQASLEAGHAQLEAAQATYRSAEAGLDSAQSDLEAAHIKKESAVETWRAARSQITSADAQVSQARAGVDSAHANLGYTTIRSPIDGIVLDRKVNIGQTVAAQFTAPDLFTLAQNLKRMQVETSVDEADMGRVHLGAPADFTVDAYPNDTFKGTVTMLRQAPITVQNVVTYQAIITCRNRDLKLEPGMTATVNVVDKTRKGALLLPNAALRFKPADFKKPAASASPTPSAAPKSAGKPHEKGHAGKAAVGSPSDVQVAREVPMWIMDPHDSSKIVEKKVVLGITDGTNTEVVKGELKVGDQAVTASKEEQKHEQHHMFFF